MHVWLAWLVLGLAWADPQPENSDLVEDISHEDGAGDVEPPSVEPAESEPTVGPAVVLPPREALEAAKQVYFMGEHAQAVEDLSALLGRVRQSPPDDPQIETEAMSYLAEIQYVLGDEAAASATLRLLLTKNPDVHLSIYDPHLIEIIGLLDMIRSGMRRVDRPVGPVRVKAMPIWGYLPFGTGQFAQKKHARGAVYATLQVGFGALSLGMYLHLSQVNRQAGVSGVADDGVRNAVNNQRWSVQWPATFAFYTTWAISMLDSGLTWRKTHRAKLMGLVEPMPGKGARVVMHMTF